MNDPHLLQRFVSAQDIGGTFDRALVELRDARKTSHWMWFVFPQLAGLGRSPMAQAYALHSLEEARAYLVHPILGPRLRRCAEILSSLGGASAESIFGAVDAMKLRSSMTLFHRADPDEPMFSAVLEQYFAGQADDATDRLLGTGG